MPRLPLLLVVFAVTCLVGCHREQPIYNVEDSRIPQAAKPMTLAQVKDAIIQAALDKGWHADEAGPGEVRVTLKWKDHSAVSSVFYTQKTYSIKLDSSVNLKEENGNIHKKYNEEVRALQSEIDRRLYLHAH